MQRWLPQALVRIQELVSQRAVRFTLKARRELASLGIGLDEEDACDILGGLIADDFFERRASDATGEWMYVFKPEIADTVLYVKVILRTDCIVISFHEDDQDELHE